MGADREKELARRYWSHFTTTERVREMFSHCNAESVRELFGPEQIGLVSEAVAITANDLHDGQNSVTMAARRGVTVDANDMADIFAVNLWAACDGYLDDLDVD